MYLNEKETYQPDLIFIAWDRMDIFGEKRIEKAPDLVVEILSPSTGYYDLRVKFKSYEAYGVKECWIVDPWDRSVEIFVLQGQRFLPTWRVEGSGTVESTVLAGFTASLERIFHSPKPPAARDDSPGPMENRPPQGGSDEIREIIPPYQSGKHTCEEYAKLRIATPRQLIGGEPIEAPPPTARHQGVLSNLVRLMDAFVQSNDLGTVPGAQLDVHLNGEEIYQPDITFIAKDRLGIPGKKKIQAAPDLAVEILSPSTAYYDLKPKFRNYEKYGVREYWIVDTEDHSVEIFVLEDGRFLPARRAEGSGTVDSKVLAGFTVSLEEIFSHT